MEKITKVTCNEAIAKLRTAKAEKARIDGAIKECEDIIEVYALDHIREFADGRLPMEAGIIAIKAGVAKPLVAGKALSTAARSELATLLPPQYVKMSCDFGLLYTAQDKGVRQILQSRSISIVRDDKYVVL